FKNMHFHYYPQLSKLIKKLLRKQDATTTTIKSYPIYRNIRLNNVVWNDNNNVVSLLDFENVPKQKNAFEII
ncbi:unnamed protein product, partial [Didymodactylos carnosus]